MQHTRRAILVGFFAIFFAKFFPNIRVQGQDNQLIEIQWRVPDKQIETVREYLNFEGEIVGDPDTIDEDRGLPIIYIFVGVFALTSIAKTLLEIYRDTRYGGIIVRKNKKGKLIIENDDKLANGTIVIDQGDDIEVIFRENQQPKSNEIIEALTPFIKK